MKTRINALPLLIAALSTGFLVGWFASDIAPQAIAAPPAGATLQAETTINPKLCCLAIENALGQQGAIGAPIITQETLLIMHGQAELFLGGPLTHDEGLLLEWSLDQGAIIGYEQGFGAARQLALDAVCP